MAFAHCPPPPPKKRKKTLLKVNTVPHLSRTSAFFPSCGIQGVAVVTPPAAFAVVALRVAQAFEAPPADVVTHSQRVWVRVAVAVALLTRTGWPGLSEGVTIVTVFTHLTAHPCKGSGQELDGWLGWNSLRGHS